MKILNFVKVTTVTLLIASFASPALAGDWSAIINGRSVHVNATEEWNENNAGLGLEYRFDSIFPGCRLLDIHEYLLEQDVRLEAQEGVQYLYHDPCHTPMKTHNPLKVARELTGGEVLLSDRCCGE